MADDVAIVGMGCRVPGASSPEELWALLAAGRDEITEIPADRPAFAAAVAAAGDSAAGAGWGGFIPGLDTFDPEFFGISPAEAPFLDPQQRLFLEVAWAGLENAGVVPAALAGSRTGVFVGQGAYDHAMQWGRHADRTGPFSNTGFSHAVTANRLSYLLDLRGPSLSVDTACSSSLVALHLAVRSLVGGECDLAVAGGVNAMVSPVVQIGAARLTALAADGRCRTFDAAGSGYVRSEGAGAVVLKRLADALRDGDAIRAVIHGTGSNQDGRTNGLTAPSGRAQAALITEVLDRAGIAPDEVDYVEAHGTGTPLGDPIEARALGTALGERTQPLVVGSIKANIGHLEAAAGILGVIKVALMLARRTIPPTPHFRQVNPRIDLDALRLAVPAAGAGWPTEHRRAIAGVSSFGFGGTNGHAVLGAAPTAPAEPTGEPGGALFLPLSGRRPEAVVALAGAYADLLGEQTPGAVAEVCLAAAAHRSHFEYRAGVVGADTGDLVAKLRELAAGGPVAGPLGTRPSRLAFVYSGHGSQWDEMGRELIDSDADFTAEVERCDAELAPRLGWSMAAALRAPGSADLDDIAVAQPLIFAVQLGLTAALRGHGITPAVVLGHSMGEVAAAVASGRLSLGEGCRVLRARNQAVAAACGSGGMATVDLSTEEAAVLLAEIGTPVVVAASNSPRSVVLSGPTDELARVTAELRSRGQDVRLVKVDYPSHGPLMAGPATALRRGLGVVRQSQPQVPFVSTVTVTEPVALDAAYWEANLTSRVRLQDAVSAVLDRGVTHLLEISAHPVLLTALRECLQDDRRATAVPSLHRRDVRVHGIPDVAAGLYTSGWTPSPLGVARHRVPDLPTYPFQRRHLADSPGWPGTPGVEQERSADVPGRLVELSTEPGTHLSELVLGGHHAEHRLAGTPVLSVVSLISLALWAASEAGLPARAVADVALLRPVPVAGPAQLVLRPAGEVTLSIRTDGVWVPAMTCQVTAEPLVPAAPAPVPELAAVSPEAYATLLARLGLDLGTAQGWPRRLSVGAGTAVGELKAPAGDRARPGPGRTPSLLDGALPVLAAAALDLSDGDSGQWVVSGLERLAVDPDLWAARRGTARASLRATGGGLTGTLTIADRSGRLLAELSGIQLERVRLDLRDLAPPPVEAGADPALAGVLADCALPEERVALLRTAVRDLLGAVVPGGIDRADADETPFLELGLDSLMAVEMRNRLEAQLGLRLSAALIFGQPTVAKLAVALEALLPGPVDAAEVVEPAQKPTVDRSEDDLLAELLQEIDAS